jgi:predicted MFS family arabinose efflux permease
MAAGVFALCASLLRNRPDELGLGQVGAPRNGGTNEAEAGCEELKIGFRAGWRMVYRSRQLWDLAVVYFAFGFSYIIYATFFIRYLVREVQMPGERAGMIWLTIGLASSASGCFWGWFSDRWGRKWALLSVFALHGSAYLLFGASLRPSAIYISAGLFAISAWSVPALMAALCGDIFGSRLAPAALGLLTIVFGIGQALGPYVAGLIADAAGSFAPAFLLACAMAGAGGVASLYLRPPVFIGSGS